jgi:hypothetical protein
MIDQTSRRLFMKNVAAAQGARNRLAVMLMSIALAVTFASRAVAAERVKLPDEMLGLW